MVPKVVIVPGCRPILTEELRLYLNQVAKYISEHPEVVAVISSGGYTDQRGAPGISEAGLMARYLRQQGLRKDMRIFLDLHALTTFENIRNSKAILRYEQFFKEFQTLFIVIFTDWCRLVKIRFLASQFLKEYKFEIRSLNFMKGIPMKIFQLLISTPLTILSYYFPMLARLQREWKKKKAAKI